MQLSLLLLCHSAHFPVSSWNFQLSLFNMLLRINIIIFANWKYRCICMAFYQAPIQKCSCLVTITWESLNWFFFLFFIPLFPVNPTIYTLYMSLSLCICSWRWHCRIRRYEIILALDSLDAILWDLLLLFFFGKSFYFLVICSFINVSIRYRCSRIRCSPLWQSPYRTLHLARCTHRASISFSDVYNVGRIYANARRRPVPGNTVVRFWLPFACWCI